MKKYKLVSYCPYIKHFVYKKPDDYSDGHLYSITWYFSLCDWIGNELDGFSSWVDEYDALDSGYYDEDTQTLVLPLVDHNGLLKDDIKDLPWQFKKLVENMKTDAMGVYYTNF